MNCRKVLGYLKNRVIRLSYLCYLIQKILRFCDFTKNTPELLRYKLLLETHCIEKGLSNHNMRLGFGIAHFELLQKLFEEFKKYNLPTETYEYQVALDVIQKYIDCHKSLNFDIKHVENMFEKFLKENNHSYNSGISIKNKKEIEDVIENSNYESFVNSRYSIRNFSDAPVKEKDLDAVFELLQKTPTACNRQMNRIYYTMDSEINNAIGHLLPGNNGFRDRIDKYLVVTGCISAFRNDEMGQWYVNGGIYLYSLVLALHANKIASCIMQWTTNIKNEQKLMKILNIAKNEQIIGVIAIGNYQETFNVLNAERKPIEEIVFKR